MTGKSLLFVSDDELVQVVKLSDLKLIPSLVDVMKSGFVLDKPKRLSQLPEWARNKARKVIKQRCTWALVDHPRDGLELPELADQDADFISDLTSDFTDDEEDFSIPEFMDKKKDEVIEILQQTSADRLEVQRMMTLMITDHFMKQWLAERMGTGVPDFAEIHQAYTRGLAEVKVELRQELELVKFEILQELSPAAQESKRDTLLLSAGKEIPSGVLKSLRDQVMGVSRFVWGLPISIEVKEPDNKAPYGPEPAADEVLISFCGVPQARWRLEHLNEQTPGQFQMSKLLLRRGSEFFTLNGLGYLIKLMEKESPFVIGCFRDSDWSIQDLWRLGRSILERGYPLGDLTPIIELMLQFEQGTPIEHLTSSVVKNRSQQLCRRLAGPSGVPAVKISQKSWSMIQTIEEDSGETTLGEIDFDLRKRKKVVVLAPDSLVEHARKTLVSLDIIPESHVPEDLRLNTIDTMTL